MKNILHWPRHKLHYCDKEDCCICAGALALCMTCEGAEGDLPTDCPGVPMTEHQRSMVANGTMDYVRGYGWVDSRHKAPPERKTSSQLYQDRLRSSSYTDVA